MSKVCLLPLHLAFWLQLLLMPVLLGACGSSAPTADGSLAATTGSSSSDGASVDKSFDIPLPSDAYLDPAVIKARQASYPTLRTQKGDEAFEYSSNSNLNDVLHTIQLNPPAASFAYALYRFDTLTMQDVPLQATVKLLSPLPASLYIGVPDYIRERWVWTAVSTPVAANTIGIPTGLAPINPGGVTYVAVVAYDQALTVVQQVELSIDITAPPPQDFEASDGTSGSTVFLTWTDVATSYPGLAYDRLLIERAEALEGPYEQVALIAAGNTSYNDVADPNNNDYPHNVELYYRISTVVAGNPGQPGPVDTGYRLLANVTGCSATDGAYTDKIVITWNTVPGAGSYQIQYRNMSAGYPLNWTMLSQVAGGSTTSFEHTGDYPSGKGAQPKNNYNYRVMAYYYYDTSLGYSNNDLGYRNSMPVAMLIASPLNGNPPLAVNFDASSSSDEDGGEIQLYEWDFDGDGDYEQSGAEAIIDHTYTRSGVYNPVVRITDNENFTDTATVPINVAGWAHSWGLSSDEVIHSVSIDNGGNVIATGECIDEGGNKDVLLLTYSSVGELTAHKTWGDDGGDDIAVAHATDFTGNIYIVGYTENYGEGLDDFLLLKYTSGVISWSKTWGTAGTDQALGLYVSATGNMYVAGYSDGFTSATDDGVVLQLSSSGALSLEKTWDGGALDRFTCVSNDGTSTYVAGYTSSYGAGGNDVLLVALNSLGNVVWEREWGGSGNDIAHSLLITGSALFLGGDTDSYGAGLLDGLLLSYDTSGTLQWQKSWGGTADDSFSSLAADTTSNIFATGSSASQYPSDTVIPLLKLDNTGTSAWLKVWHNGALSQAASAAINFSGSLVLGCTAANSADGAWETGSEVLTDLTGTASSTSGTATNVTGSLADASGTEGDPTGTIDTGGGGSDAAVLKIGPGL